MRTDRQPCPQRPSSRLRLQLRLRLRLRRGTSVRFTLGLALTPIIAALTACAGLASEQSTTTAASANPVTGADTSGVDAASAPRAAVRLVIATTPGSDLDRFAEPLAAALRVHWQRPVLIDHRSGLNGALATEIVAKSAPDGQTLLIGTVEQLIAASRQRSEPFTGLTAVSLLAVVPHVLVVGPRISATTPAGVRAAWRDRRGRAGQSAWMVATTGDDSVAALAAAHLLDGGAAIDTPGSAHASTPMTAPPGTRRFSDSTSALQAVGDGSIDLMFAPLTSALALRNDSRWRVLAITAASRSRDWPELPTMAEAGMAGFIAQSWYGLWVPADTAADRLHALRQSLEAVFSSAALSAQWRTLGAVGGGESGAVLDLLVHSERQKWAQWLQVQQLQAQGTAGRERIAPRPTTE